MRISVIGLGLSFEDLTAGHLSIIENADVLAGGERHLSFFPEFSGEKIVITKKLNELTERLKDLLHNGREIVVLASGDPLFFGIGSYLSRQFGKKAIRIYPNINSVAGAFSRINEPWHDAAVISLHGRKFTGRLVNEFRKNNKLAVLTDKVNTPASVFKRLVNEKLNVFNICVLQCLGQAEESVEWFSPENPIEKEFSDPNLMIFIKEDIEVSETKLQVFPGMPEDMFEHEAGLITKSEIRVVSLSKLMPETDSVMWDLGSGSGSISIEASLYIKAGQIFAVEKNKKRLKQINQNKLNFGVENLTVVEGVLPEALEKLPDPDRIFIGGGGADLEQIIIKSAERLVPGGVIVINTVLLKNMTNSLETLKLLGFQTEIIQMQVNYGYEMPWNEMLKSQNPVWIIRGTISE